MLEVEKYNNLVVKLNNSIYKLEKDFSSFIFLCVGTDKIIGDAFGPIVGHLLDKKLKNNKNILILGTLEKPICASNINVEINKIKKSNSCIIVIDSALSQKEDIGELIIRSGKTNIGKGLNKKIGEIGDISINGIVGKNMRIPISNFIHLQNVPLNLVMQLAETTSKIIFDTINYL